MPQLSLLEKKLTQKEKILKVYREATNNTVSMGYIKHQLYISEGNARMSELRKEGYIFEEVGRDEHGFARHKLIT